MNKQLTCIICPKGCRLQAEWQGDQVTITGHTCPRGEEYGIAECLHPTRTVTGLVRVSNRYNTMVSVKTLSPIPKEKVPELLEALRNIYLFAPLRVGQAVCMPMFGSPILVTKRVD